MPKCSYLLPPSVLKVLHKHSPILMHFFMLADMTAVTIQCYKIVSNEVKTIKYNSALY